MAKKKVQKCEFTDSAIKRFQEDGETFELNIINHPVKLRFSRDRSSASWFVTFQKKVTKFVDGKKIEKKVTSWRKVGAWPLLPAKRLKLQIKDIIANVAAGQSTRSVAADHFETVGQLLEWFVERNETDKTISPERQVQIRAVVNKHLLPRLGDLPIAAVSKATIEDLLLWPLQAEYELSTIKAYFAILNVGFALAHEREKMQSNPLAAISFKKLIKKSLPTKDGRIKPAQIPEIMALVDGEPSLTKTLIYMMVSHATRQAETRKARWSHIDLSNMTWYLPAENIKSKGHEHSLPLTDEVFEHLKLHRNFLRQNGYEGDYIFPSNFRNKKSPPISRTKACALIREVSGGLWSSHDLRKLASTTWKEQKEDWLVIKFLLNHHIPKLDRTYIQAIIEPQKRDVLDRWQAHLRAEKNKTVARW